MFDTYEELYAALSSRAQLFMEKLDDFVFSIGMLIYTFEKRMEVLECDSAEE